MEPIELAKKMLRFIETDLDEVAKMRKPMSLAQAERLCSIYGRDELRETLQEMNNFLNLNKKYISAAQTLEQWVLLKRKKQAWATRTKETANSGLFKFEEALDYCQKTFGHLSLDKNFDRVKQNNTVYFKLK